MFTKHKTKFKLDSEIESALNDLEQHRTDPEKYNATVDRIARLQKLKTEHGPKLPSPDTVLIVSANLLGIVWLTSVERETPLTSKAMNFIMRPK